jgi:hypothetical protein
MTTPQLLTKSFYVSGVECSAYLWLLVNDPSKIPEVNDAVKHRMQEGTLVGEFAKKLFPDGIDVLLGKDENPTKTKELLKEGKPLFEAGFLHETERGMINARIDILVPAKNNEWDIIEVKSSTKVKDIHLDDVTFQKYVCEKSGLKIKRCYVAHVNNEFIKNGDIDPKEFFTIENIDEGVAERYVYVGNKISEMFDVINLPECPKVLPEEILNAEYSNVAIDEFYDSLPEGNVFELYNIRRKKAFDLFNRGIIHMKDIPSNFKLNDKQKIQKNSTENGNHHLDVDKVKEFLDELEYPLYYLDFETFNVVIPKFEGTKPYQQIPFQFSLHIVEEKGKDPKHVSFLADGTKDPRPEFISALKENLGDKGNIIVYNERFEKGIIKESVEVFSDYQEWSENILTRLKDLLHPFKNFHFYHPKQNGSASIKKVLPIFSEDVKYDDLVIKNGEDASISYYTSHFGNVPADEKKVIREALEKYCELDTFAEIILVEKLSEMVNIK